MSEYQYYEFQTIDRPLTDEQMIELRNCSSRADITPTSFVNEYNWGNLKGNPDRWMEKYFDAFVYVANWGTFRFDLRVPSKLLSPETVSFYCMGDGLTSRTSGEDLIVSFSHEDEPCGWVEGEGWMSSLIPLRADLMNGDFRCLYLGWLLSVQKGLLDDEEDEPPVPPGLKTLNASLKSLASFLSINSDLIHAAAEESAEAQDLAPSQNEIANWVAGMPSIDKDVIITELIEGKNQHFAGEFRQRALSEILGARDSGNDTIDHGTRVVRELLDRAEAIEEERRKQEKAIQAHKKAEREQAQAEARKQHIRSLAGKEEELWSRIDSLIASRQPWRYNEAIVLLQDLRDLAELDDQSGVFSDRMERLRFVHVRKSALLEKFRKANLID